MQEAVHQAIPGGAVAEFERSIIRERVNAGLRAARARGVRLGRPATNGCHEEAVRRLRAQGKGIRAIARELGLPVASVHNLAGHGDEAAAGSAGAIAGQTS